MLAMRFMMSSPVILLQGMCNDNATFGRQPNHARNA
jgi:hypothetical protein